MNISMQLFLVLAACLCLTESAPDGRLARKQRPTRGFKNVEMMTARGFGKRDHPHTRTELVDMDDFLETLASSPEREPETGDDKNVESMPLDLLVMEMMNNPEFTRSVVRKFIDVNQDGMLSLDELLRNVA